LLKRLFHGDYPRPFCRRRRLRASTGSGWILFSLAIFSGSLPSATRTSSTAFSNS
jgi:hypothetical protein